MGAAALCSVLGLAEPANAFVVPGAAPAGRRAILRPQPLGLRAPSSRARPGVRKAAHSAAELKMGLFDTLKKSVGLADKEMETVVFGVGDAANQRLVQDYLARVETKINPKEDALEKVSDAELKGMTAKLRARLAAGESENDILDDAFAVVREAAWRVLKMRHYDVQVLILKKSLSQYIRAVKFVTY